MLEENNLEIIREASCAVSGAISGGTKEQIKILVESGCIQPLYRLLDLEDFEVLEASLGALLGILKAGENFIVDGKNPFGTTSYFSFISVLQEEDLISQFLAILSRFGSGGSGIGEDWGVSGTRKHGREPEGT